MKQPGFELNDRERPSEKKALYDMAAILSNGPTSTVFRN